ncbi:DUF5134 domain-containing protein [Pseudonocardia sp. TRM90224]|uniref:DUF5134 domain-containing protein n=1 Tax=Pseudonocardia sp. TRM90224 TaxID=2812678 RepID=UPI001E39BD89|nr:DUF5134 domain-containing protein [Pseudonocardia sp. TRM90224]
MFSSIALSVAFTVAFVVIGSYALVRFALLTADGDADGDRVAELSHLLMSVAMIAMAWGAGMGTLARTLQIVVFGGFGIWFLRLALLGGHGTGHGRLAATDHAVTAAAMVWMVAAMPLIMGMSLAGDDSGGHAGHGSHGSDAAMPGSHEMAVPTPGWVTTVTVGFAVLLAAGALFWAVRAWRGKTASGETAPADEQADDCGAVAVRTRTAGTSIGLARLTGARQDALCHLTMSIGMAAMLLAML